MRNMPAAPGFSQAAQNIKDLGTERSVMGSSYPRPSSTTKSRFQALGAALVLALVLASAPAAALGQAGDPQYDRAFALAGQAYRYGLPLMEFLRVRAEQTSVPAPNGKGDAPLTTSSTARRFARPESRTVVAPNVDTLYSIAQLDLGKGPIVLEHPDMGRRYFVFELLDPYTNVIGYVGQRTTGSAAGRFAIA